MFPIKVKCFFYKVFPSLNCCCNSDKIINLFIKSDYGSRRASKYSIITHLGVRVNAKEIGMTDKKEAVSLKINQINLELDSLFRSGPPPLICGSGIHFPQCDKVFTNKFLLVKETIHVLCLESCLMVLGRLIGFDPQQDYSR